MKSPLLLAGLAMAALAMPLRADVAHDISEKAEPRAGGSLTDGRAYAKSLYNIFTQNGVEAYLIDFTWQKETYLPVYNAAFVVFRDADGRYFGQQSNSVHAKWLKGTTPQEWAQSFYNDSYVAVSVVSDNRSVVGYRLGEKAGRLATQ